MTSKVWHVTSVRASLAVRAARSSGRICGELSASRVEVQADREDVAGVAVVHEEALA